MAKTIPGGAYQSADGSWHDANGKPLSSRQVEAAETLKREQAAELAKAEAELARATAVPNVLMGTRPAPVVVPVPVSTETPVEDETPKRRKRGSE